MFDLLFEPRDSPSAFKLDQTKANIHMCILSSVSECVRLQKYNGSFRLYMCSGCLEKRVLTLCVGPFTTGGGIGKLSQKSYEYDTCW